MELELDDIEAKQLIDLSKNVIQRHSNTLVISPPTKGEITIKAFAQQREFKLFYFYGINKTQLQFMDVLTKHTLIRINLDDNFHKNADGTMVRGHRVNIFSTEEFKLKNDGLTHYRSYPLPFESIRNTSDFFLALNDLFGYTHTENTDLVTISEQPTII